ncbi:spermidine/putrescine transport system substrate-binding protein [Rhodoligotrophos appendicifer]|uniref:ABC transporter substrate-binding protein n=1 Tax=Rhodoligotrophos appendicifer TaxID=987056 RepID=UPI0011871A5B|nr:spermidine/putrescine ABC transporter substrate-binding protein [Rhodoligotrophos appendicifer]
MVVRKSRLRPSRRSFLAGTAIMAAGLTFGSRGAFSEEEKALTLYNWDTYIGPDTLSDFNDASGIEVKMDLFADNDELFAKLKGGNPGYDVIVPTNDYVERMIAANMLMQLDLDKIPNFTNLEKRFQDAEFDPGRKYSLPYMWGTVGIGYSKKDVKSAPVSWKPLFDSDEYAGRISLLGDAQNVIQPALKYLGFSLNTKDPAQIKQAEELIIAQKPRIKVFADDNGQDLLASGEVVMCEEWNGDILQVMGEDDNLDYALPKEGGLLWQDCVAIPSGAPHPQNAHAFLNFINEPKVNAAIAEAIQFATPNAAAKKLMPESYTGNPAIFPSEEALAKCEAGLYLGEDITRLYDEAWTRINAA